MLIEAVFFICPALIAYPNVEKVYYFWRMFPSTQAIIIVRQLPPKDFFKRDVSLDYL